MKYNSHSVLYTEIYTIIICRLNFTVWPLFSSKRLHLSLFYQNRWRLYLSKYRQLFIRPLHKTFEFLKVTLAVLFSPLSNKMKYLCGNWNNMCRIQFKLRALTFFLYTFIFKTVFVLSLIVRLCRQLMQWSKTQI